MFRAHASPQDPCENLMYALKLLANLPKGGGNLMNTRFEGLQEQSMLKNTNELRRFKGGQPRGGEGRRPAEELGDGKGGQARYRREDVPKLGRLGSGGRVDAARKRGRCVPSSTLSMWDQQMGATAHVRGLARKLSSHLPRRRRIGMGETVLQACDEQGGQCSQSQVEVAAQRRFGR